jgi:hypothetical protein
MGRSEHTSSQEYAAMGRNLAYRWCCKKNMKSVVAGVKVTKRSACGELAKHMNDMSEKTGADAGIIEQSHSS